MVSQNSELRSQKHPFRRAIVPKTRAILILYIQHDILCQCETDTELQLTMAISASYQGNESDKKRYSLLVKIIEKKTEDLTCPVCLETAAAPIYLTCQQMHFICSDCQPKLTLCPQCREAYQRPPRRHRYAEREAQELKDLQEELSKLAEHLER